jgi:hypothetical protein
VRRPAATREGQVVTFVARLVNRRTSSHGSRLRGRQRRGAEADETNNTLERPFEVKKRHKNR